MLQSIFLHHAECITTGKISEFEFHVSFELKSFFLAAKISLTMFRENSKLEIFEATMSVMKMTRRKKNWFCCRICDESRANIHFYCLHDDYYNRTNDLFSHFFRCLFIFGGIRLLLYLIRIRYKTLFSTAKNFMVATNASSDTKMRTKIWVSFMKYVHVFLRSNDK